MSSFSEGPTRLERFTDSEDTETMLQCLLKLNMCEILLNDYELLILKGTFEVARRMDFSNLVLNVK